MSLCRALCLKVCMGVSIQRWQAAREKHWCGHQLSLCKDARSATTCHSHSAYLTAHPLFSCILLNGDICVAKSQHASFIACCSALSFLATLSTSSPLPVLAQLFMQYLLPVRCNFQGLHFSCKISFFPTSYFIAAIYQAPHENESEP